MNNKKQILVAGIFAGIILIFLIAITVLKFTTSGTIKNNPKTENNVEKLITDASNKLKVLDNLKIITTINYQLSSGSTTPDEMGEALLNALPTSTSFQMDVDFKNNITRTNLETEVFGTRVSTIQYDDHNSKISYILDNTTSEWSKEIIEDGSETIDLDAVKELIIPGKTYIEIAPNTYQAELTKEEMQKFNGITDNEVIDDSTVERVEYTIANEYLSEFKIITTSNDGTSTVTMQFSNYNSIGDIIIPVEAYNAKEK